MVVVVVLLMLIMLPGTPSGVCPCGCPLLLFSSLLLSSDESLESDEFFFADLAAGPAAPRATVQIVTKSMIVTAANVLFLWPILAWNSFGWRYDLVTQGSREFADALVELK